MPRTTAMLCVICLWVAGCGGSNNATPSQTRIPTYAGGWTGTYTITGCNQSGSIALANLCGSLGNTPPYRFNLTQSDRNVSGSFSLGSIDFPNTGGSVAQDGSLALSATVITTTGVTVVVNWALTLPSQALAGTITQNWQANGVTGSATVAGSINTAIRSNIVQSQTLGAFPRSLNEIGPSLRGDR